MSTTINKGLGSREKMIHPSRKGHTRQRDSQFKLGSVVTGLLLLSFLGCELTNNPPVLQISVEDNNPVTGSTQTFTAAVSDLDEDPVIVTWSATAGVFSKHRGETVDWTAPMVAGTVVVTAVADDRKAGGVDTARVTLSVGNSAPVITDFYSDPPFVKLGNSVDLICEAHDDDGEDITYEFQTVPKYE
ncbi:MAG: hypothetical protein JSU61_04140 [Fidelibacterota bacterium]|nr:MAG: hypothetical protein JSU61_04140 [Candidatus Neomarinimicrobiota bacterium]